MHFVFITHDATGVRQSGDGGHRARRVWRCVEAVLHVEDERHARRLRGMVRRFGAIDM